MKKYYFCVFFHSWNEWQVTIILVKNFNVVVEHNLFTCKKKWVFGGIFYAVYIEKKICYKNQSHYKSKNSYLLWFLL